MKKTFLKTAFCSFALMLTLAAPAFADDEESRDVSDFHAIRVSGGIEVVVHQGARYQVLVQSSAGDPETVETEVSRETLVIRKADAWFRAFNFVYWYAHYSVDITVPALTKVTISGGSSVRFDNKFAGDQLALAASGGSHIDFDGKVATLEVRTSGSSVATLAGTADVLDAHSSGGSAIHASRLEVQQAEVHASGGAAVAVDVHDKLTVEASGGSSVRYSGDPEHKDIHPARSARVRSVKN